MFIRYTEFRPTRRISVLVMWMNGVNRVIFVVSFVPRSITFWNASMNCGRQSG